MVLRERHGEVVIDDEHELVSTWRVDQILSSELFGVPSRSEHIELLREERNTLSDMSERSERQERRLQFLRKQLDELPTAEDAEDRAAMDLIRKVADDLKNRRTAGS